MSVEKQVNMTLKMLMFLTVCLNAGILFHPQKRDHLARSVYYYMDTETHTDIQLLPTETKAGCLSVLPRGESQWGAAFSSYMCKCHAVPRLHLGKSTEEKMRVQPLWLLRKRSATGYHDEVKKITPDSQTNFYIQNGPLFSAKTQI